MYNLKFHTENCDYFFPLLLKIGNSAAKDVRAMRPEKEQVRESMIL